MIDQRNSELPIEKASACSFPVVDKWPQRGLTTIESGRLIDLFPVVVPGCRRGLIIIGHKRGRCLIHRSISVLLDDERGRIHQSPKERVGRNFERSERTKSHSERKAVCLASLLLSLILFPGHLPSGSQALCQEQDRTPHTLELQGH
jgi:hypothetical protein